VEFSYYLHGGHDPERVSDARHLLRLGERVGRQVGVVQRDRAAAGRRDQPLQLGRRSPHRLRVVVDERRTVLVQQERLGDHRADERAEAVAEVQRL